MTAVAPPDILLRIIARRRDCYGVAPGEVDLPGAPTGAAPLDASTNSFLAAIAAQKGRAILAEVKLGSPRLGSIEGSFDPERHARLYAENGAAALSVVVEPDSFFGSYDLLARCRAASGLPTIAKDFVVSTRQLEEAKAAGADAVLLIASLYQPETLLRFADAARRLGLAPLVETHDLADVDKLEGAEWELVGVNNRDLRTFVVNLSHSISLQRRLPAGALKVAESGLRTAADIGRLRQAGFDAFLIGESLVTNRDPGMKLRELLGRS
ncbi:MAG TPA: indole-3-glycerol phosphate synthase TrpC [Thermoanaerobaculia bacterium]|nr:indole-3-glycerol phosphate synthase TrpC [Thermoanaerobaculia bacterium]